MKMKLEISINTFLYKRILCDIRVWDIVSRLFGVH